MTETPEDTARRLEAFETPQWAIDEILKREILTQHVIDPCCGRGVMAAAAIESGYTVWSSDIHDWGYPCLKADFLGDGWRSPCDLSVDIDLTYFMNPPFSKAEDFVLRAIEFGARKIVCFQRFAWWESNRREKFWDAHPPNRIYVCGSRASCWRYDIPKEDQKSGTTTAHAWFVFERGHPPGPVISRLYKGAV